MKVTGRTAAVILAAALAAAYVAGCGGGGGQARRLVDEGLRQMEEARPVSEDLFELNSKVARLGKRYNNLQDTVSEGMSLVRLISADLDRLEALLLAAEGIFREAASESGGGDYSTYAGQAVAALEAQFEALRTNRELVSSLAEMLSLVDLAENEGQLQHYVDEMDRLARRLEQEYLEASRLADQADAFYRERRL